jgi:hypothetical protein
MTAPSHQQITVATAALRKEAGEWERQSEAIGAIAQKVAGMELNRLEAGLFQLIVSPYNQIVTTVQARCQEGQKAMTEIATTLRTVADTYEREEAENLHQLNKLY